MYDNRDTEIIKGLLAIQEKIKNPPMTADNPFFKSKYVTLPELLDIARPLLAEQGLALLQTTGHDEQGLYVETALCHESGGYISFGKLHMPLKTANPQGVGSALTYARRYALANLLNIAGETDDDGNAASPESAPKQKPKPKPKPKPATAKAKPKPKPSAKPKPEKVQPGIGPVDWEKEAEARPFLKRAIKLLQDSNLKLTNRNILRAVESNLGPEGYTPDELATVRDLVGLPPK